MKIILPVSDAAQSRNRVPMGRSATAPGTWGAHQASQLGADTPAGSTGCGGVTCVRRGCAASACRAGQGRLGDGCACSQQELQRRPVLRSTPQNLLP